MNQFLKINTEDITTFQVLMWQEKTSTNRHAKVMNMSLKEYKLIVKEKCKARVFYYLTHLECKPAFRRHSGQRQLYFRLSCNT